jgi:hypothetical protein
MGWSEGYVFIPDWAVLNVYLKMEGYGSGWNPLVLTYPWLFKDGAVYVLFGGGNALARSFFTDLLLWSCDVDSEGLLPRLLQAGEEELTSAALLRVHPTMPPVEQKGMPYVAWLADKGYRVWSPERGVTYLDDVYALPAFRHLLLCLRCSGVFLPEVVLRRILHFLRLALRHGNTCDAGSVLFAQNPPRGVDPRALLLRTSDAEERRCDEDRLSSALLPTLTPPSARVQAQQQRLCELDASFLYGDEEIWAAYQAYRASLDPASVSQVQPEQEEQETQPMEL